MEVKVKRLTATAKIPTYATDGSGCFDLYADTVTEVEWRTDCWVTEVVSTGLALEVPENHVMLIFSRSGDGFKRDVRLSNCVGVIDSDYRGDIAVKLRNDSSSHLAVKPGDRIAQGLILPIERISFLEVDELSGTERGGGGFGSTGK